MAWTIFLYRLSLHSAFVTIPLLWIALAQAVEEGVSEPTPTPLGGGSQTGGAATHSSSGSGGNEGAKHSPGTHKASAEKEMEKKPPSLKPQAKRLLKKKKWAEAAELLKKIVDTDPEDYSAASDFARALLHDGRRDEALKFLAAMTKRSLGGELAFLVRRIKVISRSFLKNETYQHYQNGVILLEAGKYAPAREQFTKALQLEPNNAEVLLRQGQSLILSRNFAEAHGVLRQASELNPYEPEIRLWLGRVEYRVGELDRAIRNLEYAVENLKRSELAPIWFADVLMAKGLPQAAVQALEKDISQEPFHLLSLLALAEIRFSRGTPKETKALWQARKNLQLGLSRFGNYENARSLSEFESEMGLSPHSLKKVKKDIQTLLEQVNTRIKRGETESS